MARLIVPRTVTVVDGEQSRSAPLAEFRCERAYVLLGDPGAGKTAAFGAECAERVDGKVVTARQFVRKSVDRLSEWEGKTLFIDGLDEVRAGSGDPRRPLDQILERLERLGSPGFRLSCRAADWLGRNDLRGIVSEGGYADLRVLHLEPLTEADITRVLVDLGVSDVAGFVDKARDQGLAGLLDNPQLLGLLAVAIHGGGWPRNLRDTYELACHGLAQSQPMSQSEVNRILAAAGHLSALLLLSDRNVLVLDSTDDPHTLCLNDIDNGDSAARLRAVQSNLFTRRAGGHFVLKHAHQAAFLAARFLHRCIKQDVPVGRVLSLMSGQDGIVVTELRGVSAWLAAFNRSAREALMYTDPVGIALYGDVGGFRKVELRRLLRVLADKADDIRPWNWPPIALASLINEHSITLLSRYVQDEDRSKGRQAVVGLLLHALSGTAGVRPCVESLERTLRDATWDPWVRKSALRALLRHGTNEAPRTLNRLLDDLRDGRVEDRNGDLLGTLLSHVYLVCLGPERIGDYLVPPDSPNYLGAYRLFWATHLPNRTEGQSLVAVLRSMSERGEAFRSNIRERWLRSTLQKLVRRALDTAGDTLTASSLYDWLELIDFEVPESSLTRTDEYQAVTKWLAERPELQKELALEGLNRRVGAGNSAPGSEHEGADNQDGHGHARAPADYRAAQIKWTVFRAGKPDGFQAWSLSQAVATAGTNPAMARILLEWSLPWDYDDSGSGLSIDEVQAATRRVPVLQEKVARLLKGQRKGEIYQAERRVRDERHNEHLQERQREKEAFVTYVREHAIELQEGRCPPEPLHRIAVAYHDFFLEQRLATPRQRVLKLLHGHEDLADAAMQGFRLVVDREDLPTLREAIRLNEQKQMSRYALPVLAALDADPDLLESRSPAEIARAAALYYLTPLNVPGHPAWYRWALEHRPEPIAEALLKVTRSRVRRRLDCNHLWDFGRNESYCGVARLVAVPMLRAFPTRCTEPQISALHAVLLAALRYQVDGLLAFVDKRAAKRDLDVSQRSLWLAAGLLLSPERYVPRIAAFLEDGGETRSREIVRLLAPTQMERPPMPWGTRELAAMIKLLGGRYSPWRPESIGVARVVDEDREKVEILISDWASSLASRTTSDACDALEELVEAPELAPWRIILGRKRTEQVVARRHATFRIPDLIAVQRTLENATPANPADLAALVADRLEMLGRQIRHGTTDDWQQYWRPDEGRRLLGPRHEASCRDALLSDLRKLLPSGVDAQREALYTRGNKSDIRVFFDGDAIPVEIKKDSNPKLWRAVANQLAPKYATAPESSGFGIFLVLWFGQGKTPLPPTGRRPKTPEQLCARLEEHLAGPYRHKISVIVIDVSATGA